jgi:integrase
VNEAAMLHWSHGPVQINLTGKFPMIDFAFGDKGGHRQLPITPGFARLLRRTSHRGYVFNPRLSRGVTRCRDTWSHKIGEIGGKANIVVDPKTQKRASAHDLRRSFLQRWRGKVDAAILQILARHESFETTKQYYLSDEAESVASAIWSGGDSVESTILKELRNCISATLNPNCQRT